MEEMVDLYDCRKNPTGRTAPRYSILPEGLRRRTVYICIFSENRMLIQKRTITKKLFPGLWDVSSAGGVAAGEEPWISAERECFEELGVKIDLSNVPVAITVTTKSVFCDYYTLKMDLDLNNLKLQEEEVDAVKWATLDEILSMIEDKTFIEYHKGFIEYLFHIGMNGYTLYDRK